MIDVEQQVNFWREGAGEDWTVARELVERRRVRHGLFFAHLAIEKLLKACVVRRTEDLAPRLHNLVRLAQLANLPLSEAQVDFLAEMNVFSIEGRYPDSLAVPPSAAAAQKVMERAGEVMRWLTNQL